MRALTIVVATAFLGLTALSPAPASAEPMTTEIGAQAKTKRAAKPRDCSRVGRGFTGWRAREARRFCRMGQG